MWSYRDWVIDAFNRNLPFDQFTIEQLAGDLLPNRTLDQQVAIGLQSLQHHHERRRRDRRRVSRALRPRSHGNDVAGLDGADGRLRGLPRSQVRSDHADASSTQLAAFFNNTTQAAMDGNIKDTPPIMPVPMAEDRARLRRACQGNCRQRRKPLEARKTACADRLRCVAARPQAGEARRIELPIEGLASARAARRRAGKVTHDLAGSEPAKSPLADRCEVAAGAESGQALTPQGPRVDVGRARRFRKRSTVHLLPPGCKSAGERRQWRDLSPGWTTRKAYRGWDFWVQRRQIGTHIINTWPDNALKVVAKSRCRPTSGRTWPSPTTARAKPPA